MTFIGKRCTWPAKNSSSCTLLLSNDADLIAHARKLATQARDPAPHYQHSEIGYNDRLSNVLAGIGRGQLRVLEERVRRKREIFETYRQALGDLPGIKISATNFTNFHEFLCFFFRVNSCNSWREPFLVLARPG